MGRDAISDETQGFDDSWTTNVLQNWPKFEAKMQKAGLSNAAMDAFRHNYEQLIAGVSGLVGPCKDSTWTDDFQYDDRSGHAWYSI